MRIADRLQTFHRESPDIPPRLFVLVDSDRLAPDAPMRFGTTWAKCMTSREQIKNDPQLMYPEDYEPKIHALKRREVENYIPIRVLENMVNNDDEKARFMKRYRQLSAPRRHYLDLKNGLSSSLKRRPSHEPRKWKWSQDCEAQRALYCEPYDDAPALDEMTLRELTSGLEDSNTKLHEAWNSDTIDRKLLADDAGLEFDEIISEILEQL